MKAQRSLTTNLVGCLLPLLGSCQGTANWISVGDDGPSFTLSSANISYQFHVDPLTLDLVHDHWGAYSAETVPDFNGVTSGWSGPYTYRRREFPDLGRGDFRVPAIHIQHSDGDTVSAFSYTGYDISPGKPSLPGLPATYGSEGDVSTLTVHLYDNYSDVSADLYYSIFPRYNAITRSFQIANNGSQDITVLRASSWSIDMPNEELEMLDLHGDWASEAKINRRPVVYGEQGFRSSAGYSSHFHNPFVALSPPTTTESLGSATGYSLVYTGSFSADVERWSTGWVRVLLGLNPLHLSWPVAPGETFTSPEVVSVYSEQGLGGMSRSFHSLYKNHLSRSNHTFETRPPLLNSWEGLGFDFNQSSMVKLAEEAAGLGCTLFVNDDGWFGTDYPRNNDSLGLGDWTPNPAKFPDGLGPYVEQVDNITVSNSSEHMQFGLWVEPEMVSPDSDLYKAHPDWAMHAGTHNRTLQRNQLVLNLGLPEVQDYIITIIEGILDSAPIRYIKWDNNRGMHEMPSPSANHAYMLGLYHVIDNLTTAHPEILWEGCASGGARFDPGLLHYWPQTWTSDDTDGLERLYIQFGTSYPYPPSAMGCHVSAVPNGQTGRTTPLAFRAAVASMCGSFGLELDPSKLDQEELDAIPTLIATQQKINPIVINGDFYRLALPDQSNWPAAMFVSPELDSAVLFAFQVRSALKPLPPPLKLQGLDSGAKYKVSNGTWEQSWSGSTLMNTGLSLTWPQADYESIILTFDKQ
ncbi:glycoside hydrolase family 36 protein [Annulohypoxylon truncatum]|uniref:glycoside hydrolase family 36 protein n=1 Tax=Annulohypoxylon truncatum TaxID=327061 RepID=UPI00200797FB|nr:glycoside hydrolase family 36 protein [Annulohypoxylon truncatum]KAI1204605.1 glycoside hydrolase family 36 protein [Annulohypoxylon truncatum]